MLQLPGFPGTRTAPEPDFPLEVIPHIFVASHASHASDEVPTGPNEAMGSYECHCSCHQDFCHLCMCSKKRSKKSSESTNFGRVMPDDIDWDRLERGFRKF